MKGFARIRTDAVSGPHPNVCYAGEKESAKRSIGESRMIELQKRLDKDGIRYTTAFGLDGAVEILLGRSSREQIGRAIGRAIERTKQISILKGDQ